jgi:excisionase family DNA binding protein
MDPNQMLSLTEAAEYLGVSVPTLRKLVAEGDIPVYRLGKRARFYTEDLHRAYKPVEK